MNIINNKMLSTSIKYIYLSLCILCFFKHFFSSIELIDSFLISLETYLPLIGIVLVLFFSKIEFKMNKYFLIIACILYFFATAIGNQMVYSEYIFLAILAVLFSDENPKQLFKYLLIFNILFLSINLTLSQLEVFPYNIFERDTTIRHAFNFYHPNSLGIFCLSTYTLICYVMKKYKAVIIAAGALLFYFTFFYVNSRTSGLLIILILILHILYWIFSFAFKSIHVNTGTIKKVLHFFIVILPSSCFLFSIISSLAYSPNNALLEKLNSLLSMRIILQYHAIINDGIPLLGIQKAFLEGQTYDIIDSFYIQIIYRYGLIFEIALIIFISYLLYKNIKRHNTFIFFWVTMTWVLFGLSEPFSLYFCFNPFLLLLFNNYQEKEEISNETVEVTHE